MTAGGGRGGMGVVLGLYSSPVSINNMILLLGVSKDGVEVSEWDMICGGAPSWHGDGICWKRSHNRFCWGLPILFLGAFLPLATPHCRVNWKPCVSHIEVNLNKSKIAPTVNHVFLKASLDTVHWFTVLKELQIIMCTSKMLFESKNYKTIFEGALKLN